MFQSPALPAGCRVGWAVDSGRSAPRVACPYENLPAGRVARQVWSPSSQVERGVTTPSAGVVYSLANELGISLDFLFGETEVEPDEPPRSPAISGPWGRATGPGGAGIVQRAGDRNTIELSTGVRWERLTPVHDSRVDFIEVVYPASLLQPLGRDCPRAIRRRARPGAITAHTSASPHGG
jgi:hypothetical protein